jgi:hypothetical protein
MDNIKIFVSYRHQNDDWVKEGGRYNLIPWLKEQLASDNVVFWTDHVLKEKYVGVNYTKKIRENISDSDIALLLISQEFTASDFIMEKELSWIKDEFDNGRIKIIPLLIEPLGKSGKNKISWIFELQTIPSDITPLISYTENEIKWKNIRIEILDTISDKAKQLRNTHEKEKHPVEKQEIQDLTPPKLPEEEIICESAVEKAEQLRSTPEKEKPLEEKQDLTPPKLPEEEVCESAEKEDVCLEENDSSKDNHKVPENGKTEAVEVKKEKRKQFSLHNFFGKILNIQSVFHTKNNSIQNGKRQRNVLTSIGYIIIIFSVVNMHTTTPYLNDKGDMYFYGSGVEKDYGKAFDWYEKAAKLGDAKAQCQIGLMYRYGLGITQDYSKAKKWFEKAAHKGDANAQYNLGVLYHNGQGVAKDYAKAREWYQKAAEQGNAVAQKNLNYLRQIGH